MADPTSSNLGNMLMTGGKLSIFNGPVNGEDPNVNKGLQELLKHISPFAFHNSINRSQEVDRNVVKTLVQKWTTHIETHRNRLPTSPLLSSIPIGPLMEPHPSDRIINDVFNWLFDYSTPFLVMWIHDKTIAQTILVAQVIAGILNKLDILSASFFSGIDSVVSDRHVIPTLAHQLALRSRLRKHVGQAVADDGSIFNLETETQLEKLLCKPILSAFESGTRETQRIPNIFVFHGLENYDEDQFQSPFLQDFVGVLHLLRASDLPHRLLVIGQHTSFLQSCTSKANMRQTVLERPITASIWFGREAEIRRREEDLRGWEEGLRRKEEDMQAIGERMKSEREELEFELEKIKNQKGELKSQRTELRSKVEELKRKGEELECEKNEWNQKGRGSLGKEVELEEKDEDIKRRRNALQLDEKKSRIRHDKFLLLEAELSRQEGELSRRVDEVSRWEGGLSRREDEVSERRAEMGKRENELSEQEEKVRRKGAEISNRENELSKREEEVRRNRDPGPNQRQDSVASTSALSIEAPQLNTKTKSFKEKWRWLSPRSEGRHSTPVSPADVYSNFMPSSEPPDRLVLPLRGIDPRKLAEDTCCTVDALKPFCNGASMLYIEDIALLVTMYLTAIDYSIEASHLANVLGLESINLANSITRIKSRTGDANLERDVKLSCTLAQEGYNLSKGVLQNFRNIILTYGNPSNKTDEVMKSIFEKSGETLTTYHNWWNDLQLRHSNQLNQIEQLASHFNFPKHQGVVDQWKELQKDYKTYSTEIIAIQKRYLDMNTQA